jgi:hypothetical protein
MLQLAFDELAFKKYRMIDFYVEKSMYSFPPLFDLPDVGHDPKSTESWPTTPSTPPTSTNITRVDVLWSNNTSNILLQLANYVPSPKSSVQPLFIELFANFFNPFVPLSIQDFDIVDDNICDQSIVDFDCIVVIIVASDHVVVVPNVTNSESLSVFFKVYLKSCFLDIDKELDNVNKGDLHVTKHTKLWASNAFDDLDSFGVMVQENQLLTYLIL